MTWQPEIDELRKREELGRRMGGADKIKRHHDLGKLTVRERIAGILDAGSFHEIGAITGKARNDAAGELVDMVPTDLVMARRFAAPSPSSSRRSSIRATRAACCANSPGSPRRCAPRAPALSA